MYLINIILNNFETAILRILIKKNHHPVTIHSLIDGFPDGSEHRVVDAIKSLKNLNFVHVIPGSPQEEEYIVYNFDKKIEILKIINPIIDVKTNINAITIHTTGKVGSKKYTNSTQRPLFKPIIIMASLFLILFNSVATNMMPTSSDTGIIFDARNHNNLYKFHHAFGNKDNFQLKPVSGRFVHLLPNDNIEYLQTTNLLSAYAI